MSTKFALDALERAVKTFAQSALALLGANAVHVLDVDWGGIAGVSATAAIISVLTSVVSLPVGDSGTASVVSSVNKP